MRALGTCGEPDEIKDNYTSHPGFAAPGVACAYRDLKRSIISRCFSLVPYLSQLHG